MLFYSRRVTEEERNKVKQAMEKEKRVNQYIAGAVERMTPKKCRRQYKGVNYEA